MNLAKINKMIRESDLSLDGLRYLLNCRGECEWLDFKEDMQLEIDKHSCDFTRDIIAMKNVGGGFIVVGVRDKTWAQVGLANPLPYDSKMLRDKVRKASGLDLDVLIVSQLLKVGDESRHFSLIHVRSAKKRNKRRVPSVVKTDFAPREKYGLHKGDIFVRRGDSSVKIQSQEELSDLLDELDAQMDEDELNGSGLVSPFVVNDGLYRLLEKGFSEFVGRDDLRKQVVDSVTRDPRIWIVNVHGPGGVGKSALVNWATYEFYRLRTFEAIVQLSAKETMLTASGILPYSRSLYSLENLLDHLLNLFDEPSAGSLEAKRGTVYELLSAWSTLLVLDNMETVSDGRILSFIQELPQTSKAKVLLTSRHKTGGWELPIPVTELNEFEVREFVRIKAVELGVSFPLDSRVIEKVRQISGGLPLAMQWIVGRYKQERNIDAVLNDVLARESPVLEFSFRNIWDKLSSDAKSILGVITIFEAPPTTQQIAIATGWPFEKIEKSLTELAEVTLVTRYTQPADGQTIFAALPITLKFAQHRFDAMGDFETSCRQRLQKFNDQLKLQEFEVRRFATTFEQFGLDTSNERRAAILCRRGGSEMLDGNVDSADALVKQARELAPQSAYVFAMSATYELARNRVGIAFKYAQEACAMTNKRTGGLCFGILARVLQVQRDWSARFCALEKALEYDPENMILKHQYGVALSMKSRTKEAISVFTEIIDHEKSKQPLTPTLLMAVKTRCINLRRLGLTHEADADLKYAKEVLSENPHLQHQSTQITDLED